MTPPITTGEPSPATPPPDASTVDHFAVFAARKVLDEAEHLDGLQLRRAVRRAMQLLGGAL
jgi:hypothetical protein